MHCAYSYAFRVFVCILRIRMHSVYSYALCVAMKREAVATANEDFLTLLKGIILERALSGSARRVEDDSEGCWDEGEFLRSHTSWEHKSL